MSRVAQAIVVGHARSAASSRALTVAAELATDLGARLYVVHVVEQRDYPIDPELPDWEIAGAAQLEVERAEVEQALAGWPGDWAYDLRRGDPVHAIIQVAARENARLIVVGVRGRAGFGGALERLLGASSSIVHGLERANIPVLVVPTGAADKDRERRGPSER